MPKVPTYQPRVEQAAMPGVALTAKASPDAFGAPLARSLGVMADINTQIAYEAKQQALEVDVQGAERRLVEAATKRQLDDKSGWATRSGKDAFGIIDPTLADYDKDVSEIEATLANDEARAAFKRTAEARRQSVLHGVSSHVARQMQAYDNEEYGAFQVTATRAALANYQTPDLVEAETVAQEARLQAYAKRNGKSEAWVADERARIVGGTYSAAIGRMIDDEDEAGAKEAMTRWGDSLAPEQAAELKKGLEGISLRGKSQKMADRIVAENEDLGAAMAVLAGIEDPKLRDETEQRVVRLYGLQERALQMRSNNAYEEAASVFRETGDITQIPEMTWLRMDEGHRQAMEQTYRQRMAGKMPADNGAEWQRLRSLAVTDPVAFQKEDLRSRQHLMSERDFREVFLLRNDVAKGGSPRITQLQTAENAVDAVLKAKGWDPKLRDVESSDYDPEMEAKVVAFRQQFDRIAAGYGDRLDFDKAKDIAEKLMVEVSIPTQTTYGWPGVASVTTYGTETKLAYEIEGIAHSPAQVPAVERAKILQAYADAKKPAPDDATVMRLYNTNLARTTRAE